MQLVVVVVVVVCMVSSSHSNKTDAEYRFDAQRSLIPLTRSSKLTYAIVAH